MATEKSHKDDVDFTKRKRSNANWAPTETPRDRSKTAKKARRHCEDNYKSREHQPETKLDIR